MEHRIENRLEQILESKILDVSVVVANTVTARLLKAMGKAVRSTSIQSKEPEKEHDCSPVTPDKSKIPKTSAHQPMDLETQSLDATTTTMNSTQQMLMELDNIERQKTSKPDPPHDTPQLGSKEIDI